MKDSRLSLALAQGGVVLPVDGQVAVFGPTSDHDLSPLPKDRVQVIQGFKPFHDHFARLGFDCRTTPDGAFSAAVMFMPRARQLARMQLAQAMELTNGGPVLVDGQKTDGIDSMLKECRKRGEVAAPLSKAHGKLFVVTGDPAAFGDWHLAPTQVDGFTTAPGVFSADGVDRGSALLAGALPDKIKGNVADFGAGWGYLAAQALSRTDITALHLVEADHTALDCARANVTDPRAQFHWADVTRWRPPAMLDVIITNPPFHTSRAADPALGQAFLRAAALALTPSGQIWLVANRHLPYERHLADLFRNVEEISAEAGFKLLHATHPATTSRRGR